MLKHKEIAAHLSMKTLDQDFYGVFNSTAMELEPVHRVYAAGDAWFTLRAHRTLQHPLVPLPPEATVLPPRPPDANNPPPKRVCVADAAEPPG